MSKYKLLFLDMDGTTLKSDHSFPAETVAAIDKIRADGVKVCLSTGRGMSELKDYEKEQDHLDYGVLMSGGAVYDFVARKAIFTEPVPLEVLLKVIDRGEEAGAMIHLLTVNEAFAPQNDIDNMENFLMKTYQPMFRRFCTGVTGVDAMRDMVRARPEDMIKINLYHRSAESREESRKILEKLPMSYSYAERTSFEVSAKGITKAAGLKFLCRRLGIDTSLAVALGDGENDREILTEAGLGIAMGNASDEIKAVADAVTLSCEENGVLAAIEKYF